MAKVLITGASGFIGSFLVEEGLKRNHTVYAGVRKSSSRTYLKDPRIIFIEIDLTSAETVAEKLADLRNEGIIFDYIIHNAGVTKAQRKEDFFNVNVELTRRLVEGIIRAGVIPSKFIYISSLAAYGPGDPKTMRMVMLDDTPKPIEIYGRSKLEAEKYIRTLENFPYLIFRPTGVYGPREKDYYVFFKTINRGLEPYVGTREQVLTFIYVKDLVRLIFDAAESSIRNASYFVSDGNEYSSKTFSEITKRVLRKKTLSFVVPSGLVKRIAWSLERLYALWGATPTLNTDKYNVISSSNWRCDVHPLKRDFNFEAEYDLEKGVGEAIEWYKNEGWI
jgi:nucleoside-diphosphate-sugar epimerase